MCLSNICYTLFNHNFLYFWFKYCFVFVDTDTFSGKDLLKTAFALEDGEIEDIDIQDESETSTGSQQKHKSEKLETATNGDKDEIFVTDDDKCKTTEGEDFKIYYN